MVQVLTFIGVQWPTENITVVMVPYSLFYGALNNTANISQVFEIFFEIFCSNNVRNARKVSNTYF